MMSDAMGILSPDKDFFKDNSSVESDAPVEEFQKLISDELAHIYFVVLKCAGYEVFSIFGIVTNVMNIVTFCRLGFQDTVNVTLLGLTLSDLGSLLHLFWMGICFNPLFTYSDVHFDTRSVVYLSGGWPKLYFTRVTSWITAFVALERCLCIAMPLKVKTLITPRRSVYVILFLFIGIAMTMPPVYVTTGLSWQYFPERNKTLLGLAFTENRIAVYSVVIAIHMFLTVSSFLVVIVCTLILVINLKWKSEWRHSVSSVATKGPATLSSRDKKVSKMVVLLSAIFIVSLFPGTILFIVMLWVPEFNKGAGYHNLFTSTWAFCHLFEATNSSVNIFVYFNMSSKFRQVFLEKVCFRRSQTE